MIRLRTNALFKALLVKVAYYCSGTARIMFSSSKLRSPFSAASIKAEKHIFSSNGHIKFGSTVLLLVCITSGVAKIFSQVRTDFLNSSAYIMQNPNCHSQKTTTRTRLHS